MKRFFWTVVVFGAGIVVGVAGLQLRSAAGYWRNRLPSSSAAVSKPMQEGRIDPAYVRSGDPSTRSVAFAGTWGGGTTGGVWECVGPATIDITFNSDEHLYVLEGGVDVDYLGNRFSLNVGDAAFFRAGTSATWDVKTSLKKAFVTHAPSPTVKSLEWLFAAKS